MYFTIRQSPANRQWYWRLLAANNEIIANGEGYVAKASCLHAIRLVDGGRNLPIYEV